MYNRLNKYPLWTLNASQIAVFGACWRLQLRCGKWTRNPNAATHQCMVSLQLLLTHPQQVRSRGERYCKIRFKTSRCRRAKGSILELLWVPVLEQPWSTAVRFDLPLLLSWPASIVNFLFRNMVKECWGVYLKLKKGLYIVEWFLEVLGRLCAIPTSVRRCCWVILSLSPQTLEPLACRPHDVES